MNITIKAILLIEIDLFAYIIIGTIFNYPIIFIAFVIAFFLILADWVKKEGDELVKEMRRI